MRRFEFRLPSASLWPGLLLLCSLSASAAEFDWFENKIRPVLVERCYKCHSSQSDKLKGGLLLDSRAGMLKGGESGQPAIVPGDAERSRLIEAIRYKNEDLQMPPPKQGKLSEEQIAHFVAWVNMGAPDPRTNQTSNPAPPLIANANTRSIIQKRHWAFQLPREPALPNVKLKSWPKTPLDYFILARLEEKGLKPSPPADKRTLIRRATSDLTGLPPTAGETDAFLQDPSPKAYEKVVDRLLASPRYGERWGRYWLDVARYSDTKGYVYDREEKRFVHSHVYRDWVIRAFNQDLPYDQFLIQQIAADQLPSRLDPQLSEMKPQLAAMGFLTVGRRFLGVVHDIIDDRIDVLARGTMGLTLGCARCHDHKFDPIPTKDYYSLYGVFYNSTEQTVSLVDQPERTKEYEEYEKELRTRQAKLNKTFEAKRNELTDRLRARVADYLLAVLEVAKLPSEEFYAIMAPDDLNPVIARRWEAYLFKTRAGFHPIFAPWHAYAALAGKDFPAKAPEVYQRFASVQDAGQRVNPLVLQAFSGTPPASMREVAQRYGKLLSEVDKAWREALKIAATNQTAPPATLDPNQEPIRQVLYAPDSPASVPRGAMVDNEWFFDENTRVELSKLHAQIDKWIIEAPGAPPHALILADRETPRNARVFIRGNPANKGDEVPRQFLEVLSGPNRRPFQLGSGRLELARAIASRDNPLTARVMVNRVWLHHFGSGLVRTPSDFGTRCEPPSHPELLDWLATRFGDGGWSIKSVHRLIMLSSVYQQRSDFEPAAEPNLRPAGSHPASASKLAPSPPVRETLSALKADPNNRLLWRMNRQRLDFESMRDSLLAVSGELDLRVGGKPVDLFARPVPTRRTVYGFIDRQFLPGAFRIFDFANPDLHSPQRSDTTVPQQALFFMNSPFLVERSRALASRPEVRAAKQPEERIQQLYRIVFQRPATARQVEAALGFLKAAQADPPPEPPKPVVTAWQYGYGEFDESARRVTNFQTLPHFTGDAWQGGPNWPDPKLGWVQLTADGGHAGNDLQHAAVRRWLAPRDLIVSVSGTVRHEQEPGDGIRAFIVSSRSGLLASWTLHNQKEETRLPKVELRKGDSLDFVVDFRANLNSDMFKWAPVIQLAQPAAPVAGSDDVFEWSAKKEFRGPPAEPAKPLSAWEQYAQALLLSNEFLFVD
jgi:Protein of unknown function (DUF1549)/Protein of unknown function (DUF1553)/Planctomycete cytochrome C